MAGVYKLRPLIKRYAAVLMLFKKKLWRPLIFLTVCCVQVLSK